MEYKTEKDIYDEIERILLESGTKKYGVGQSLFFQLPLFCDPSPIIPAWCWEMIEDYNISQRFNIPVATSLDDASSWHLDCFVIIDGEMKAIEKYRTTKNG